MLIKNFHMLMEEADDATLLGGAGGGIEQTVVDPDDAPADQELVAEGLWKGVTRDLADDPIMAAVGDVPTLVKNYVHAQRQMGKKGFILPTSNDDGDKWRELYSQLGGPTPEEYKYDTPEDLPLNEEFVQKFNQAAHNNHILPHQAKAMMDFYLSEMNAEEEAFTQKSQEELTESMNNLKQEWGEGFDKKVGQAQNVVHTFGDEQLRSYLDESGLGNDPMLVKLLAKVGESLNEDTFQKDAVSHLGLTPDEAQEKINIVMSDFGHPYHSESHANHKNAVKEMTKWYEVVHGR